MTEGVWQAGAGGVEMRVRVTPRGGRDVIEDVAALSDGRPVVKVRVRAAPEDGAANEATGRVLAKVLDVTLAAVALRAGATSRLKTFLIAGDRGVLSQKLARLAGATVS
jgi:uncharacterized protein YggU (UPF0235/DUF167 family)